MAQSSGYDRLETILSDLDIAAKAENHDEMQRLIGDLADVYGKSVLDPAILNGASNPVYVIRRLLFTELRKIIEAKKAGQGFDLNKADAVIKGLKYRLNSEANSGYILRKITKYEQDLRSAVQSPRFLEVRFDQAVLDGPVDAGIGIAFALDFAFCFAAAAGRARALGG